MADPAPREVEDDRIGRRVVAGLADELDGAPASRRGEGDARRRPGRRRGRRRPTGPMGDPMTTITRGGYRAPAGARAAPSPALGRLPRRRSPPPPPPPWSSVPLGVSPGSGVSVGRGVRVGRGVSPGFGRLGRPRASRRAVPSDPAASSPSDSPSLRVPGSRSGPGWSTARGRSVTGCATGDRTGSRSARSSGRARSSGWGPVPGRAAPPTVIAADTGQRARGDDRRGRRRRGPGPGPPSAGHRWWRRPTTSRTASRNAPSPAAADRATPGRMTSRGAGSAAIAAITRSSNPSVGSDARARGQRLELARRGERIGQLGGRRLGLAGRRQLGRIEPADAARSCVAPGSTVSRRRSRPRRRWVLTVPSGRSVWRAISSSESSPKKRSDDDLAIRLRQRRDRGPQVGRPLGPHRDASPGPSRGRSTARGSAAADRPRSAAPSGRATSRTAAGRPGAARCRTAMRVSQAPNGPSPRQLASER